MYRNYHHRSNMLLSEVLWWDWLDNDAVIETSFDTENRWKAYSSVQKLIGNSFDEIAFREEAVQYLLYITYRFIGSNAPIVTTLSWLATTNYWEFFVRFVKTSILLYIFMRNAFSVALSAWIELFGDGPKFWKTNFSRNVRPRRFTHSVYS